VGAAEEIDESERCAVAEAELQDLLRVRVFGLAAASGVPVALKKFPTDIRLTCDN
jgi:hypothetical protein